MSTTAYIEHQLPNRLRLRIPSERGNVPFFEDAIGQLRKAPGVTRVSANPTTGSLLVCHKASTDAIVSVLVRDCRYEIGAGVPSRTRRQSRVGMRARDPNEVLAVGLSGLGVLQVARGQVTGSAAENLWNAYRAQTHLKKPWLSALLVGFGLYQLANGELLNSATALMFYALTAQRLSEEKRSTTQEQPPEELGQPAMLLESGAE
ncbi:HMA2 domain-containing protein [Methylobacterium sp. P31]